MLHPRFPPSEPYVFTSSLTFLICVFFLCDYRESVRPHDDPSVIQCVTRRPPRHPPELPFRDSRPPCIKPSVSTHSPRSAEASVSMSIIARTSLTPTATRIVPQTRSRRCRALRRVDVVFVSRARVRGCPASPTCARSPQVLFEPWRSRRNRASALPSQSSSLLRPLVALRNRHARTRPETRSDGERSMAPKRTERRYGFTTTWP